MKKHVKTDTLARKHDTGISLKFWQLAKALETGWDMMNEVLEREWQILKTRNSTKLWSVGREKEGLASQLQAIEKRIDLEIPGLDTSNAQNDARWKSILSASSSPEETARLISWKTGLAVRKKTAFETNRRLWVWISEQQEMGRRLTAILSGRKDNSMTYTPVQDRRDTPAQMKNPDVSGIHMSGLSSSEQDMRFFSSFSRKKIDHAMKAYTMAGSNTEGLESWD